MEADHRTTRSRAAWPGRERATPKGAEVLLTDATVLTMDEQRNVFAPGFVWMKQGRIRGVGPMAGVEELPTMAPRRALPRHIVMPGLVNCHTHLDQGFLRGIYDEMPLDVWFSRGQWSVLDAMTESAAEAGACLSLLELMSTGVTTTASGEPSEPHPEVLDGVLKAVERAGVRAVISRIVMDSPDESRAAHYIPPPYRETPARAEAELRRLQQLYNSDRVSVTVEALGALRCTSEMIRAMHQLALETNSLFTMHVASSQDERDESQRRFGHGSVSELEQLGVLGPRTLLAHCIWVNDREVTYLADRQTGVSHNPVSNAYYAAGIARLGLMLEKGVRVGLGVDGATTNNSQNVWETMKMAMLFQKQELECAGFGGAELALELMTRGGAAALHMEDEIGSLEPGKCADVIAIDTQRLSLAPVRNVISNMVYANDPWAVSEVYVDGELVVSKGVHRSLNVPTVIENAERALIEVIGQSGLDSYLAKRSRWSWQ